MPKSCALMMLLLMSSFLENDDKVADTAAQLMIDYGIYPCLLDSLTHGYVNNQTVPYHQPS